MSDSVKEIITRDIDIEAEESYLDYAMSVIVGRALPDIRDGLKPVHRRVLYAMEAMGNYSNKPYKKSARVVGDVIGKYHPHGDTAAYDTIVRMAQDFSMRYILIDGQGNFGSVDGDSAAAMRYTEVRMSKISHELLADLDKETVDFRPNYDETEVEPVVLPTRVPNLLINGSSGIAVGMATNIPPHNLQEVIDAVIALTKKPDITIKELIKIIPGPDFPTSGIITIDNKDIGGIESAYLTGKGKVIMQAVTKIEEDKKGKQKIIVTELPYQVNKAKLIERIAELVRDKKIEGISELRDESDKDGMRIVIELKKGELFEVILNNLLKQTQMQSSFGINMVALLDGKPRTVSLKTILVSFIEHRKEVVTRRTIFDLRKAKEKAHLLEGLAVALSNIDAIVQLIKESKNSQEAKTKLLLSEWNAGLILKMLDSISIEITKPDDLIEGLGLNKKIYFLSENQAQAILEMRLSRLTALEQDKIFSDYKELINAIKEYNFILNDNNILMDVIREELTEIKNVYADKRRTQFKNLIEFSEEDLIKEEDLVITLSQEGYLKAQAVDVYSAQKRGGRGKIAATMKEEDFIKKLIIVSSHESILCFSNRGQVYELKAFKVPQSGRGAKGKPIINILNLQSKEEKITTMLNIKNYSEDLFVIMATKKGQIVKNKLSVYSNLRSTGVKAVSLKDGDSLIGACISNGKSEIMLFSDAGKAIKISEDQIKCQNRGGFGNIGMRMRDGFSVISMISNQKGDMDDILIATENGYGKRAKINDFENQGRGGQGKIISKTSLRNGKVIGAIKVNESNDLMLITGHGTLQRISVKDISILGRNTQGVRLQKLKDGEKIEEIARIEETSHEANDE